MTIKTRNIADQAVTSAKIADGAVDTATQLAAASISQDKLADNVFATNHAAAGYTTDGIGGTVLCARAVFDASAGSTQAAHALGATIPIDGIVVGGYMDVVTVFHSTAGGADLATVAISVEGANDIQTAAQVNGAPWSTVGRKAIVPKLNTPESTGVKASVARAITATVGTCALTAGKAYIVLFYVVSTH